MSLFGGKQDERHSPVSDRPPTATRATKPAAAAASGEPVAAGPHPGPIRDRDAQGGTVANIGKSISIKGDLTGNEDLEIEGKVEGKVELPNNQLTVGANGTVRAEVSAKSVIVVGRVSGNIQGTERIEIQATGVVEGDVSAPRLVVAEGAVLNGSIQMTKGEGTSAAKPAPAAQPAAAGGALKAG